MLTRGIRPPAQRLIPAPAAARPATIRRRGPPIPGRRPARLSISARVVTLRVPRHACSPRGVARAGDTWRLVQEAAVIDSEARGWPPDRFKALGTGFVVREMVALHHREPRYSEALPTKTWIAESRRGILMRRETRVADVASCSAEWVHVGPGGTVARASPELEGAFPVSPSPATEFPVFAHEEAQPGPDLQLVPGGRRWTRWGT